MTSGVYQILNAVTGKSYVGSAANMRARLGQHRAQLAKGTHHSQKLQRSWDKHGAGVFTFTPLLICGEDMLTFYEQRAIDAFDVVAGGYNILPFARSGRGVKRTPETRAKMSAAQRNLTPEQREARRVAATGRQHTEAAKKKVGDAARGRKHTPETKAVISAHSRNASAETREKLRAAMLARPPASDSTRAKLASAQTGRVYSDASREKMRASRLAYLARQQVNPQKKGIKND